MACESHRTPGSRSGRLPSAGKRRRPRFCVRARERSTQATCEPIYFRDGDEGGWARSRSMTWRGDRGDAAKRPQSLDRARRAHRRGASVRDSRRRLGWAGDNPVRALDRSERPRSDQRERRVLSSDELERMLEAANGPHRMAIAFSAMSGCRLGEVRALRWRSVDLDAGTASIREQLDRFGNFAPLKTSAVREPSSYRPRLSRCCVSTESRHPLLGR